MAAEHDDALGLTGQRGDDVVDRRGVVVTLDEDVGLDPFLVGEGVAWVASRRDYGDRDACRVEQRGPPDLVLLPGGVARDHRGGAGIEL